MVIVLSITAVGCQILADRAPASPVPADPTATRRVEPSATRTPPAPTAAATWTPTPAPTPTSAPVELLAEAERSMHNGDYRSAAAAFRSLLARPLDDATRARSLWGLGSALLRAHSYPEAGDAFQQLRADHPQSDLAHDAALLLGDALLGARDPLGAADAYRTYLEPGTVIAPYVNRSLGDAYRAGGEYPQSVEAYRRAIAEAPVRSLELDAREKLALSYAALGDTAAAMAQYDAILTLTQEAGLSARIGYQAAETLIMAGQFDAGYRRHLTVVETYPTREFAHRSLVALVQAGQPVDDLLRGTVNYYAGAYGLAVEALYRHIRAYPDTHASAAHWYAGLSFARVSSPEQAIYEFELLIDTHRGERYWGEAWLELARVHANQNRIDTAVDTYRGLVDAAPAHPLAPQALWQAAQLLERAGDTGRAVDGYLECQTTYPASDFAARSLFRAGLLLYEDGRYAEAAPVWDTLVRGYPDSQERSAALLWLGKARLAEHDPQGAREALAQAQQAGPEDYYGLRAGQLSAAPDSSPFPPTRYEPSADEGSRAEAETWLAGWLGPEPGADLGNLSPHLVNDGHRQRGRELWRLGRFQEAKTELEALRRDTYSDALSQYQLALEYRDIGLYRSSILAAARVIALSPVTGTVDAPRYIVQLAYPTYYEDLVLESAGLTGLDPLVIFSLIRQESLFESLATSIASARGLMQVIPPTGAEIASELNWPPDYETADLYRPYVSLPFGTYYLAKQRDRFDGRIEVALAAYNGGPANAQRWIDRSGDDPDLFLESITLSEPHLYVRRIKEHLAVYQALYDE